METIGERIVNLRESLDMKQKDLAQKIGVTQATMCKYENNQSIPNADVLRSLSKVLHTTADYLIGNSSLKVSHDHEAMLVPSDDKELFELILSLSHDDKIRIMERAAILNGNNSK